MNYKIKREGPLLLILIMPFIIGAVLYPHLPEQVPIHWNVYGEADDYGSKLFGTFFLPLLNVGMYILFIVLPKIDPRRDNYLNFSNAYLIIRYALHLFFVLIFAMTIAASFGYPVQIGKWITAAAAILFIIIGLSMRNVKHNYFVGFKYPWTLANEEVWIRTHRLGAILMAAGGLIALIGAVFTDGIVMFVMLMVGLLLPAIVTAVYSYVIYKRIAR